jgi:hypothetical protein
MPPKKSAANSAISINHQKSLMVPNSPKAPTSLPVLNIVHAQLSPHQQQQQRSEQNSAALLSADLPSQSSLPQTPIRRISNAMSAVSMHLKPLMIWRSQQSVEPSPMSADSLDSLGDRAQKSMNRRVASADGKNVRI